MVIVYILFESSFHTEETKATLHYRIIHYFISGTLDAHAHIQYSVAVWSTTMGSNNIIGKRYII